MAKDQAEKVRENRARRAAERQGLRLTKSKRRDPRARDYGMYWLTDESGEIVTLPEGTSLMSLEQVEKWLDRPRS